MAKGKNIHARPVGDVASSVPPDLNGACVIGNKHLIELPGTTITANYINP
jgi:hypothetical protein